MERFWERRQTKNQKDRTDLQNTWELISTPDRHTQSVPHLF